MRHCNSIIKSVTIILATNLMIAGRKKQETVLKHSVGFSLGASYSNQHSTELRIRHSFTRQNLGMMYVTIRVTGEPRDLSTSESKAG